jgi:SAM-dependent methyltransferase
VRTSPSLSRPGPSDAPWGGLPARLARLPLWRWPLPALLAWAAAWGLHALLLRLGAQASGAWLGAALLGGVAAVAIDAPWRRAMVAAGFPLSSLAAGAAAGVPAWAWLLPLLALALAYPLRSWGDAPMFPTPAHALEGLAALAPLPPQASVLDAGCGLGHGLRALQAAYPQARLHGIEWSAPLAWLARLRCRGATVRRGDMWAPSWQDHALVYLFQRPESMARAWAKACAELAPGAWLVSLAFEVPGVAPVATLGEGRRRVWVYRTPGGRTAAAAACPRAGCGTARLKGAMSPADMQNMNGSTPTATAPCTD